MPEESSLSIREYEARDGGVVVDIDREFQRENGRGTQERPFLEPPDYNDISGVYHRAGGAFWVVEAAGAGIVAFGGVLRVDRYAGRLRRFRVRAAWRRQGIATLLLQMSERFCREQGITTVRLGTADDNQAALGFYRCYGYVEVGEHIVGEFREIELAKKLSPND